MHDYIDNLVFPFIFGRDINIGVGLSFHFSVGCWVSVLRKEGYLLQVALSIGIIFLVGVGYFRFLEIKKRLAKILVVTFRFLFRNHFLFQTLDLGNTWRSSEPLILGLSL